MLYFILTWSFATIVCFVIGVTLLNLFQADSFKRSGDRLILAIWLGIIVLAISFLAASLVVPLSSAVGMAIAISLAVLSLLSRRSRCELVAWRSVLSGRLICGCLTIELAVAALVNQPITWFDTGLYHLSTIRWLSEFGAVPGVALINSKLGFTSSWFALSAPLIPAWLGTQVGAITNGFAFLVAVGHFLISLNQGLSSSRRLSDWLVVVYLSVVMAVYVMTAFTGSPILISFSPDVAITLLIGVIGWAILIISSKSTSTHDGTALDERALVLILGAGAVTIKLSALPLLAIAFLFYLFGKLSWKRVCWGSALLLLLLLPMLAYGVIASGCPLYPSKFGCLNLPWSLTTEKATADAADVGGIKKVPLPLWWWNRLVNSVKSQVMFLSLLVTIIVAIWSLLTKNLQQAWLFALSLLGMTFILAKGPWLRFGLGYFVLVPSLLMARYCQFKFNDLEPFFSRRFASAQLRKPLTVFLLLFFVSLSAIAQAQGEATHFLVPHRLPKAEIIAAQVNNVKYIYPANWTVRCWAAELPCAPTPRQDIQLRNPSRGIGAGFVRAD